MKYFITQIDFCVANPFHPSGHNKEGITRKEGDTFIRKGFIYKVLPMLLALVHFLQIWKQ